MLTERPGTNAGEVAIGLLDRESIDAVVRHAVDEAVVLRGDAGDGLLEGARRLVPERQGIAQARRRLLGDVFGDRTNKAFCSPCGERAVCASTSTRPSDVH